MKSCDYLNNTLTFTNNSVIPCFTVPEENIPYYFNYDEESGIEITNFEERRRKLLSEINDNNGLHCKNCCHLKDNYYKEQKYNLIVFKYWSNKATDNLRTHHEIIKRLYEQDLIDKENLSVYFNCSDINIVNYFEETIKLFKENGYRHIDFVANNIEYNYIIEDILSEGKGSLTIIWNLNDTKKIEFKPTAKILRSYLGKAENKNEVKIYYSLIKNYNDSKKEIKQFIQLMYKTGINTIGLRLDNEYINKYLNNDEIDNYSKKIGILSLFFFKLAKKYSFYMDMNYEEQNIVLRKIFKKNKLYKTSLIEKIKNLWSKNEI